MIFKFMEKKYSAAETTFAMTCLGIVAACGVFISLLRNLTLCFELGKDGAVGSVWTILPESITLLTMAVCSALVFVMIVQVRKKQVFTLVNAGIIQAMGLVVEFNGIIQFILQRWVPGVDADSQVHMIFILVGVFFLFISCLFKLGIQMQEEQELTV